ncbi:MAG: hypothetical protein SPL03_02495 [Succinivibrio dextrinosolvens]|nr:hypothetical protein [Succinivibrio dextrinosolvens]
MSNDHEKTKMSKSDKAFFVCFYYLFIITLPALVGVIGYEYKFLNSSWYVMTITAVLIVLPNVFFIQRSNSIEPESGITDRHPGLTLLGVLLVFFALFFSVGFGRAFFIEDEYEKETMSRAEYSHYLLNKYSPDVLQELEKLNTKQLISVNNIIDTIPGVRYRKAEKIREGIKYYCSSKLSIIPDEEFKRIQNSIYEERLKKSLNTIQSSGEISTSIGNNINIQTFADLIQVAKNID